MNILVFFIFRTGSSFIMQVLNSCYSTHMYGDYGEILTLSEIKQTDFAKDLSIPNIETYANTNLDYYIRYLQTNSPQPILLSKLSLFQIFDHIENKTITFRNTIKSPTTHLIIITRNLLDVYISWKKTTETKKWGWVDTSDIKITVNPEEFYEWYNETSYKYTCLFDSLTALNKPYVIINYDEMNKHVSTMAKIKYILTTLYKNNINLKLNLHKYNQTTFLPKQDTCSRHKDQIANYEEFKTFLISKSLGFLIRL